MYRYKLYEDNGGFLHLAVLDNDGNCVYYLHDNNRGLVMEAACAVNEGFNPIADGWAGGEPNPQECYNNLRKWAVSTYNRVVLIEEG